MPKPLIILFVSLFLTSATKQRIKARKHSVGLWGSEHNLDAVALPCENELARHLMAGFKQTLKFI